MVNMRSKAGNFGGFGIASHEGDASDEAGVFGDEGIKQFLIQHFAYIFGQMRTVASRAVARTIREIQGECYLARNLLKNYIVRCYF